MGNFFKGGKTYMAVSFYKDIYNLLTQKHPNRKIFIISDPHYFHSNIIQYERPQFSDILTMNEYIIKVHNETVGPDDVVIILGDFCFKKSAIKDLLSRMNGHIYLILGNHDNPNLVKSYGDLGFEGIFTTPVKMQNNYFSHEPLIKNDDDELHFKLLVKSFDTDPNGCNYHGHIHTPGKSVHPYYNVTCEALDYKPLLIGYTGGMLNSDDSPLIINSDRFQKILEFIKEQKNLEPNMLITDYIYSILLEANSAYAGSCFVYGSFALYKKFGYISNFSDLDVGLIYNKSISKVRNSQRLKEMVDRMYASVRDIDGVNISFIKRIVNMCAFETTYANKTGYYAKCVLDANLIPYSLYRDSDFVQVEDRSTIDKLLSKENPELLNGIHLPNYQAQYFTTNGDMANLILQILFQKGHEDKKIAALKKLKYIFKKFGNNDMDNTKELEDIITRFFLRNMLFFYTLRRSNEIEYLKANQYKINELLKSLPVGLSLQLEAILKNPNSDFNLVFKELTSTNFNEIPTIAQELIAVKKKKLS